jgi:hypothetical protein
MLRRIGTSYCWGVLTGPRLRQVALVAGDLGHVAGELREAFGRPPPLSRSGGGTLRPDQCGVCGGRHFRGYMAIFQVRDLAAAHRRVAGPGVRVVWTADLPGIAATHLHPSDVPGAIVSLDWAAPEQSWRWAGPRPGLACHWRWPAICATRYRARCSERLSAEDAQRLGIVNALYPPADFEREVMKRARRLAQGPSIAYRYMKENLNRAVSSSPWPALVWMSSRSRFHAHRRNTHCSLRRHQRG